VGRLENRYASSPSSTTTAVRRDGPATDGVVTDLVEQNRGTGSRAHLASSNIAELAKEPKGVHPELGGSGHACPQPSACPCWAIPAESGNTPARLQPHDTSRVRMHARMDSKARKPHTGGRATRR